MSSGSSQELLSGSGAEHSGPATGKMESSAGTPHGDKKRTTLSDCSGRDQCKSTIESPTNNANEQSDIICETVTCHTDNTGCSIPVSVNMNKATSANTGKIDTVTRLAPSASPNNVMPVTTCTDVDLKSSLAEHKTNSYAEIESSTSSKDADIRADKSESHAAVGKVSSASKEMPSKVVTCTEVDFHQSDDSKVQHGSSVRNRNEELTTDSETVSPNSASKTLPSSTGKPNMSTSGEDKGSTTSNVEIPTFSVCVS